MQLWSVEGNTLKLDGGSMFGHVPKEVWQTWEHPDERNRILLASRCLLLKTDDGRHILFEAGMGIFFDQKLKDRYGVEQKEHQLLKNLEALGITENDIDAVVLSHLHFDHAGGLLSSDDETQRLLFPKAHYYVSDAHWKNALSPHIREKVSFIPHLHDFLKASGRLKLIEGPTHPDLDFGVHFEYSDGHTLGLILPWIDTPAGPLVFVSDLIPGSHWVHVPIYMGYDRASELKVDEKKKLLEKLASIPNSRIFLTHDYNIPCMSIQRDAKGYTAVPAALNG